MDSVLARRRRKEADQSRAQMRDGARENFFLMPAPLNNRFDFQTRQNFKKKYTGSAWASVRLFVKQALALQRKFGRY